MNFVNKNSPHSEQLVNFPETFIHRCASVALEISDVPCLPIATYICVGTLTTHQHFGVESTYGKMDLVSFSTSIAVGTSAKAKPQVTWIQNHEHVFLCLFGKNRFGDKYVFSLGIMDPVQFWDLWDSVRSCLCQIFMVCTKTHYRNSVCFPILSSPFPPNMHLPIWSLDDPDCEVQRYLKSEENRQTSLHLLRFWFLF